MSDAAQNAVRRRERLPSRRPSETRRLHWAGRTIHLAIGYDPNGFEPREIFYSGGYKRGSDMESLVSDLCIALSVMLQHEGVAADTLRQSMGRAFDQLTGEEVPASILGLLLDELCRPPDLGGFVAGADLARDRVDGPEISRAGDADRPGAGEAGRTNNPGPEAGVRHETADGAPDPGARDGGRA